MMKTLSASLPDITMPYHRDDTLWEEESSMKTKKSKKTPRYRKADQADGRMITRSAFELFFLLMMLVFLLAAVFSTFFRIVTFSKKAGDRMQMYSVVTDNRPSSFQTGDIVSVDIGNSVSGAEVLATEGEQIILGTDKTDSVNCVLHQDVRYFSYEELQEAIGGIQVPDGYVLLNGDLTSTDELSVGELVRKEIVTGKVEFILYPFSLFGRTADYL